MSLSPSHIDLLRHGYLVAREMALPKAWIQVDIVGGRRSALERDPLDYVRRIASDGDHPDVAVNDPESFFRATWWRSACDALARKAVTDARIHRLGCEGNDLGSLRMAKVRSSLLSSGLDTWETGTDSEDVALAPSMPTMIARPIPGAVNGLCDVMLEEAEQCCYSIWETEPTPEEVARLLYCHTEPNGAFRVQVADESPGVVFTAFCSQFDDMRLAWCAFSPAAMDVRAHLLVKT